MLHEGREDGGEGPGNRDQRGGAFIGTHDIGRTRQRRVRNEGTWWSHTQLPTAIGPRGPTMVAEGIPVSFPGRCWLVFPAVKLSSPILCCNSVYGEHGVRSGDRWTCSLPVRGDRVKVSERGRVHGRPAESSPETWPAPGRTWNQRQIIGAVPPACRRVTPTQTAVTRRRDL